MLSSCNILYKNALRSTLGKELLWISIMIKIHTSWAISNFVSMLVIWLQFNSCHLYKHSQDLTYQSVEPQSREIKCGEKFLFMDIYMYILTSIMSFHPFSWIKSVSLWQRSKMIYCSFIHFVLIILFDETKSVTWSCWCCFQVTSLVLNLIVFCCSVKFCVVYWLHLFRMYKLNHLCFKLV